MEILIYAAISGFLVFLLQASAQEECASCSFVIFLLLTYTFTKFLFLAMEYFGI